MQAIAELAYRTDTGRQRNANEDAYFARAPLFAVADGMGGAQAGEVASRLAAESFEPVQRGEESPEAYLRAIARTANARIHRLAQADSSRSGMGTTLTAALVEDNEVSFAHVGDSRAYLVRGDLIQQISEDHSLVNEQIKAGMITPEEAKHSRYKNIITRSVGFEEEVQVDVMGLLSEPGDVFVLCSDGMANMVEDPEILHIVRHNPLSEVPRTLVDLANERGGDDNITVIAVQIQAESVPVVASATTGEHAAV